MFVKLIGPQTNFKNFHDVEQSSVTGGNGKLVIGGEDSRVTGTAA